MPTYTYQCASCEREFEIFQHYTDDPLTVCQDCGTVTLRKVYSPTPVHFKGEGWYAKDKKVADYG